MLPGITVVPASTPPTWLTVFSQTLNSSAYDAVHTFTIRSVFTSSALTGVVSATKIRITLQSNANGGFGCDEVFIGQQAGSGDPYDYASTPTRITFSGSNGFSIAGASSTLLSDEITFPFAASTNYVIAMDVVATAGGGHPGSLATFSGATAYDVSGNDAQTVNASGYTTRTQNVIGVSKIEIFG